MHSQKPKDVCQRDFGLSSTHFATDRLDVLLRSREAFRFPVDADIETPATAPRSSQTNLVVFASGDRQDTGAASHASAFARVIGSVLRPSQKRFDWPAA